MRVRRFAPWIAGLLLAAGIATAVVTFVPSRNAAPQVLSQTPPKVPVKQKSVPLEGAAKDVARLFIKSAVARTNLAAAWKIAGPNLRGGLTYREG